MAVAGLALVMLAGSFAVGQAIGKYNGFERGRMSVQEEVEDSIEQARGSIPDASVLNPSVNTAAMIPARPAAPSGSARKTPVKLSPRARQAPQPSPTTVRRKVGWNYLVVQSFSGPDSAREAAKALRFIQTKYPAEYGPAPVTIEGREKGGHVLLSTIGYATGDNARKEAFVGLKEQIRRIGKLYSQQGGAYDFHDAYAMRLSKKPKRR
jgi:hypothetical protein